MAVPEKPTLVELVRLTLRREELPCNLHSPYQSSVGCQDAIDIRDEEGGLLRWERCAECPLTRLDRAQAEHPALGRAQLLYMAVKTGITLTLRDVTVDEFQWLQAWTREVDKRQAELLKRPQDKR